MFNNRKNYHISQGIPDGKTDGRTHCETLELQCDLARSIHCEKADEPTAERWGRLTAAALDDPSEVDKEIRWLFEAIRS